jgi:hypothetical protein
MSRRGVTFVREGCATEWAECPNGGEAITVVVDGQQQTSCIDWHDLTVEVKS